MSASAPRYRLELATTEDDAALRALVRGIPHGGSIQTTLRREPSYFGAAVTEGPFHQVLVARDTQRGQAVGMATRSVRKRFVDGEPSEVGYLGGLRLRPDIRHGTILARGFRMIRAWHQDGRTPFYLTMVADGNRAALDALTGQRADLPRYTWLGRYFTFVLPKRVSRATVPPNGIVVRQLTNEDRPSLVSFLNEQGRSRLFAPCFQVGELFEAQSTYRDLLPEQIVGVWRDGILVGTLAAWDQRGFKQTVVESYQGVWCWGRFAFNGLARCMGWPRFPPPGEPIPAVTLALPCVAHADPITWRLLWQELQRRPWPTACDMGLLGLFERDPLCALARRTALHTYTTHLFVVDWPEESVAPERFIGRDIYLELGCL